MSKLFSQSIKLLLFGMVFIMAFFAAGIIVYSGISFRNEKISEALKDSAMLADSLSNEHEKMVADAHQLMLTLAQLSEIKNRNVTGMQQVLKEVLSVNPKYSNMFVADRAGRVLASAVPAKDNNVSDRRYFINALTTGRFSSGEFIISRFTGKPVIAFGYPFKDKQGEILGVIVMGIDMRYYKTLLDTLELPFGSSYLLIDHRGFIMTRGINPTDFVGQQYDPEGFKRMTDGPEKDSFVALAHDGIQRFISYRKVRLEGEQTPYMYIRSGIPVDTALSGANKALMRNLILFTASLCFVVVFILLIAKHSIIDRIALLEMASKRLADGDMHVKVSNLVTGGELGRLGLTFDHMARQITSREEALRESEQRYHTLFEQSPDGILLIDAEGKMIEFNETAHFQLGYSHEEFEKLSLSDIDPVESPEEIRAKIGEILKEGRAEFVVKHRTKQGEVRDVNIITKVIVLSGRPIMYAIWHDITESKKTEEKLMSIMKAVESASDAIGISDSMGHHFYQNKALSDLFEYTTAEELESAGGGPAVVKDPQVAVEMFDSIIGGKSWAGELEMVTKSGRVFTAFERADAIKDKEGNIIGLIGIITDITQRRRAEDKIRQSEEFVRSILDSVDEGFIVIDRDYRILTANKAYCGQVARPCDETIGKHCYEVSHGQDRPCYEMGEECAVRQVFETGEPYATLHKHPESKGSILYVETKAFPIKNNTGAVTSVIETVNNITEKHLLEEEQLKTQKLEAIGTLAGGIAHDFNNLLQGVFGYISMAKIMHDQKQKSLDMLKQAEKALNMSVNLTSQLLTFSKGGKPLTKRIALQSAIENSVKFALSGSRVDYRVKVDQELWIVEADEGQIGQVIQNLVLNAEQAMPMGGTITITAKNVSSNQKGLPALQQGNYVEITIKDRGIGIPEQYLTKIFDPYFTTKDKGSGLGLATSYSIIKNHGGVIDVKSKLGEGTTFFVYLPAVEAGETSAVTVSEDGQTLRKGRILLMDDEDIIRNIAGIMIKSLGHEVELAVDGEETIAKYRESMKTGRQFDIVIMDLTIRGGMGGEEAIKELLLIDPNIKAIVSSGYTDSSAMSEYKTIGFKACLTKPYDIDSLKATLNSVLD